MAPRSCRRIAERETGNGAEKDSRESGAPLRLPGTLDALVRGAVLRLPDADRARLLVAVDGMDCSGARRRPGFAHTSSVGRTHFHRFGLLYVFAVEEGHVDYRRGQ